MIDEILGFVVDILLEFIPNSVWKLLLFLTGLAMTVIGTSIISESAQTGGALIIVGGVLIIAFLLSLF